jgi:hypothetical protein
VNLDPKHFFLQCLLPTLGFPFAPKGGTPVRQNARPVHPAISTVYFGYLKAPLVLVLLTNPTNLLVLQTQRKSRK